ncbi:MAG: RsmD family RNA methyltransferase [Alphaproteobacteria bacterium]|nr:RsmD family RNA methyltransferase [Alphaproteobacteria bacterium]
MDSKLQIISGQFRGRKLQLPPDARPTQNRARIALFNMLESGIINPATPLTVWDAFAGSGAFGLECLSRYAGASVVFTDVAPTSIKTIRDNLATLNVGARATVAQVDAIGAVNKYGAAANLVFVDPPYSDENLGRSFVARLASAVRSGALVIWEQEIGHEFQPDAEKWDVLRDKTYGRARFLILQKI